MSAELGPLAVAGSEVSNCDVSSLEPDKIRHWLAAMIRIRKAESTIARLVEEGTVRCPCHLVSGQEAVAVAAAEHFRPGDHAYGAHRSHGHYLALGGSLMELFSEILGKESGCSKGMGGSMHLRDPAIGLEATVPIVGATIPIATGAALASKIRSDRAVSISFFGDGATEEGVFHESLNLASQMNLPVVFVCENNLFSSHLHISLRQPSDSIARFGHANRVKATTVDGNDVVEVQRAMSEACERARGGAGPSLIEAVTYRWYGHVGWRDDVDVGVARTEALDLWKRRDPVRRLSEAAVDSGKIDQTDLIDIESIVEVEITEALGHALQSSYPQVRQLFDTVYCDE